MFEPLSMCRCFLRSRSSLSAGQNSAVMAHGCHAMTLHEGILKKTRVKLFSSWRCGGLTFAWPFCGPLDRRAISYMAVYLRDAATMGC